MRSLVAALSAAPERRRIALLAISVSLVLVALLFACLAHVAALAKIGALRPR